MTGMSEQEVEFRLWLLPLLKEGCRTERFYSESYKMLLENIENDRSFELSSRFTILNRTYLYRG
jgi:hypothetical protein